MLIRVDHFQCLFRNDYFDQFAPKCGACCRPIEDNFITALNVQWHPKCFVCAVSWCCFDVAAVFVCVVSGRCVDISDASALPQCFICMASARCVKVGAASTLPQCFVCTVSECYITLVLHGRCCSDLSAR